MKPFQAALGKRSESIVVEALESRRLLSVGAAQVASPAVIGVIGTPPPTSVTTAVQGVPVKINAENGESWFGAVGYLKGYTGRISQLHGTINWGDGTPSSPARFVRVAAWNVEILGAHTWTNPGIDTVETIVTRQIGAPGSLTPVQLLADIKSLATVRSDTEGGVTLSETLNQPFVAKLGTIDYLTVTPVAGTTPPTPIPIPYPLFQATVDWGDGQTSTATVVHDSTGGADDWAVIGGHVYTQIGKFNVHIVVTTSILTPTPVAGATAPTTTIVADFYSTINVFAPPPPTTAV